MCGGTFSLWKAEVHQDSVGVICLFMKIFIYAPKKTRIFLDFFFKVM